MSSEDKAFPDVIRPWIGSATVEVIRTAERTSLLTALDTPAHSGSRRDSTYRSAR
jgi:hypothetical protein